MNDDGQLAEWLKWIAGGILAGLVVFWQWMERKVDQLREIIDKLRDDTRKDRHDLANRMQARADELDGDIGDVKERVTRLERNGK